MQRNVTTTNTEWRKRYYTMDCMVFPQFICVSIRPLDKEENTISEKKKTCCRKISEKRKMLQKAHNNYTMHYYIIFMYKDGMTRGKNITASLQLQRLQTKAKNYTFVATFHFQSKPLGPRWPQGPPNRNQRHQPTLASPKPSLGTPPRLTTTKKNRPKNLHYLLLKTD